MVIWYVILPKSDPEYLCPAAVILQGPCFLAQVPWERTWCPMAVASPVSTGLKSSKSVSWRFESPEAAALARVCTGRCPAVTKIARLHRGGLTFCKVSQGVRQAVVF